MAATPSVAVIGCGQWGKNLVRNFFALGALRAVCDENPVVLEELGALHAGVRLTQSFSDILKDPEIQACVIAAPAGLHHALTREALVRGKDVFVKKPLALRVSEGRELVTLAEKEKRILMVGHVLECHPAVVRLKLSINGGAQEAACDACRIRYRRRGLAIARAGETAHRDLAMS